MSRKTDLFEKTIEKPYDHSAFIDFSREFLNNLQLVAPTRYIREYGSLFEYFDGYYHIGNYFTDDKDKVAVFSVALHSGDTIERARSLQRNYIVPLIESGNCQAALVAFYTKDNPQKWRLSFVRVDYNVSEGNYKRNITPAKRYSYLVGDDEPSNTAKQRLFPIFNNDLSNPSIDDLEEAFSVEKVTNEFFQEYKNKFIELKQYLDENEDFIQEAKIRHFTSEQFAKKLLGQIVFLYFIQKKGWLGVGVWPMQLTEKEYNNVFYTSGAVGRVIKENLPQIYEKRGEEYSFVGVSALEALPDDIEKDIANHMVKQGKWGQGDKEFVKTLFEWAEKKGKNFFNEILEPLFYDTLNNNRGEKAYCPFLHCRIPFLNGGLFEELDGYDWKNNDFKIPNEIFSNEKSKGKREANGILDIFNRYNFTMNEDEPMEREVAIDPEMLGKVFENLLDVSDRKSKGAFYTPREIVHYMCQESLINYLVTKSQIPESDIRDFIQNGEFFRDIDTEKTVKEYDNKTGKYHFIFDNNKDLLIPESIFSLKKKIDRLDEIDKHLSQVKVADLSVGSGAFPLGMLNEIVKARENISAYMAIEKSGFQKLEFYAYDRKPYDIKLNTIKNSIFACDIEPSAVDIAKLRLWLSIVIDDEISETANSTFLYGAKRDKPNQLPNLNCNIICGNSLIEEFMGHSLISETYLLKNETIDKQYNLFQKNVDGMINELINLQGRYFSTKVHEEKIELMNEIKSIYNRVIVEQLSVDKQAIDEYYKIVEDATQPFVLWQLYFPKVFAENGGFDIVIGNPPYVGESGHKEIFRPIANTEFGHRFYQGKMDLFYFFFHKGLDLLAPEGELSLITTNYFPTATGAKNLRHDLKERSFIRRIVNFNEVKVFESALGQHNMITSITKKKNNDDRIIDCEAIQCNGSYVASSNELNNIMYGKKGDILVSVTEQNNLYDGDEAYIRVMGVNSTSENSFESILDKISSAVKTLNDYADVNQGVLTGCDTVTNKHLVKLPESTSKIKNDGIFVLDMEVQRDMDVINGFSEGKTLLKDFYKNSDISKYYCSSTPTKKLIYYTGGINKKDFPDVYEHMSEFKEILEARLVTYNEKYHWTAIHRPRNGKVFEEGVPKIVVPYRTKINAFAYNEIEWFCRSDCYVITSKNDTMKLKTILALLNSDTYYFWLYNRGKRKGEVLELFQKPLTEIPIKLMDEQMQNSLICKAEKIMEMKIEDNFADTSNLENEINEAIYREFNFTEEEIKIIKSIYNKGE